ncbi:MAG: amidohydrolase [Luminiphilus sp.]|nr:amidohydrolase [Luminiphilus sp.]
MGIRLGSILVLLTVFALNAVSDDSTGRKVFLNGSIYSMDDTGSQFAAMVVEGGKIVYLGDDSTAMAWAQDTSEVTSLGGRTVLPGFIDTHIHIMDTLPLMDGAMLSPSQSADEVLESLRAHVLSHPEQNPVLGAGFLARAFGIDGPTAAQLDEIVMDKPALIIDEGGHTAWANSKAMALAGITKSTPDPVPGAHFFQRDEDGVPTGWLVEGAAIGPVATALNLVSKEVLEKKAPLFFAKMAAVGLTAAFDAGMIDTEEAGREVALALAQQQRLPVRVVASLYVNRPSGLINAIEQLTELNERYNHPFFEVSTLKLSLDGTVEAKTAVTLEPYLVPEGHRATPLLPADQTIGTVVMAAGRDIDLHLHAIGDGAVRTALNAIEAARAAHPDTASRFTICHIEIVDSLDIPRFAALNVVGQTTPTWFEYDYLALEYLGRERFQQLYPIASIKRHGAKITLGSDYPVTWIGEDALNPLFNIEMAVTRQQAGNPDYPIQAKISERLSVDQAIRAHTIDAAWQLGMEGDIGSLELNKLADFVILDNDPYTTPIHDLHSIRVDRTYSDGRLVYERER